ncbi:actin-5, muscle-specific-like [Anopheles coustani]|uniref:actin-5, muscle-specific-like n=1 Tax=Anopheles coustani TaxID=139045 RepID=UPI0026582426|nr:actin-5, muscle-specific-like [Anopheles coustani]
MDDDETPAVVIDNGSYTIKAGLTGDDDPKRSVRTILELTEQADGSVTKCIGGRSGSPAGRVIYPIERGVPTDWDALESVWEYTLRDVLKVAPEEHKILLTERPLSAPANREKAVQIVFEKLGAPATYLSIQALLALYAAGRLSGTVVDVGEGLTSIVPIYKNSPVREAIVNLELAGSDMVEYLAGALALTDRETVREVLHKVCTVSADLAKEATSVTVAYRAPDGRTVTVGKERFLSGEALFNPGAIGHRQDKALPDLIVQSLMSCKENTRKDLFANVILAGGSVMLGGFGERMQTELGARVPAPLRCKVIAPQNPALSVWAGGCLLAQSPMFQHMWITKQDYEEFGAGIVHRKCS